VEHTGLLAEVEVPSINRLVVLEIQDLVVVLVDLMLELETVQEQMALQMVLQMEQTLNPILVLEEEEVLVHIHILDQLVLVVPVVPVLSSLHILPK
jgi:hypothetical protein